MESSLVIVKELGQEQEWGGSWSICERTTRGPCKDEIVLHPDFINVRIWLWYWTIVLQAVTTGKNWVKGTQDLSILLLIIACESANFSNKKKVN